jgi:hypothetical protein
VQTVSLGPGPSGRRPSAADAVPYGRSRVRRGWFSLYDLPPGTYAVHYVAGDRSVSAVGAIDVTGKKGTCGSPAHVLDLVAKSGVVPPLTSIDHPPAQYAKRDLHTGLALTVSGFVKPRPDGASGEGWVYVARAPEPVGGGLEVRVKGGEIEGYRRVSLRTMRAARPVRRIDVPAAAALGISAP